MDGIDLIVSYGSIAVVVCLLKLLLTPMSDGRPSPSVYDWAAENDDRDQ